MLKYEYIGYIDDSFVRMTITGKVDDILQLKYPIQLEDIFKETKDQRKGYILPPIHTFRETGGQCKTTKEYEDRRKVVLLEGAPGCGKSTLSVYICQQWEKGRLFNQFKFVILI